MSRGVAYLYYLFISALLCYFVGEYAVFPMKPAPLQNQTLPDILIRLGIMAAAHLLILGIAFGFWGFVLAAALVLFHTTVDLITRPFFGMITGKRVILTLVDLALHIVAMLASATLLSLFMSPITYTTAQFLRYGAMAATGILFYPVLAKTLLVDGFPRYYAERPLFEPVEWLIDAAYGLLAGTACIALNWWLALIFVVLFTVGYFFISSRFQQGRPVLVLSKIGVLVLLVPCFLFVFKV